jgi:hypothetical protein
MSVHLFSSLLINLAVKSAAAADSDMYHWLHRHSNYKPEIGDNITRLLRVQVEAFLATTVERVEAVTIVLSAGHKESLARCDQSAISDFAYALGIDLSGLVLAGWLQTGNAR